MNKDMPTTGQVELAELMPKIKTNHHPSIPRTAEDIMKAAKARTRGQNSYTLDETNNLVYLMAMNYKQLGHNAEANILYSMLELSEH